MPVKQAITNQRVPVKIWTDDVDERSKEQLANIAGLPFVHHHVAAMPDVHLGIGATIGSVIATHKAIIPAAVGVDIGCGMVAARLSITANDLDEKALQKVFDQITRDVPVGRGQHADDRVLVQAARPFEPGLKALTERHPQLLKAFGKFSKWTNQMGTLGGGNHFIEVCLDEADQVWVMLHSGSRGIGNAIADYFIQLARKDMERWMIQLPDRDLAYFPEGTEHFADYVEAVHWAQEYAMANRQAMLDLVQEGKFVGDEELSRWLSAAEYDPSEKIAAVTALYDRAGAGDSCLRQVDEYSRRAIEALRQIGVDEAAKQPLYDLANSLIKRDH